MDEFFKFITGNFWNVFMVMVLIYFDEKHLTLLLVAMCALFGSAAWVLWTIIILLILSIWYSPKD